jgi:hypothetical protein
MENTSWFTRIGVIAILVLVVWNIYKGATVQELGIPGFTLKFGDHSPSNASKSPADSLGQSGFSIRDLSIYAKADESRCPVTIHFHGAISALGHGGVTYRFVGSQGVSGPIETVMFSSSGTQEVETTYLAGKPGTEYQLKESGWGALEILEPQGLSSKRAPFAVDCLALKENYDFNTGGSQTHQ